MADPLTAKTQRYERLLTLACRESTVLYESDTPEGRLGREHLEMADSYLRDGRHFLTHDDLPNALAAFAYGHGWLDAGIRAELVDGPRDPSAVLEE